MAGTMPPVVLDCGTGFSKLGFAGDLQPSCVIPTVVSTSSSRSGGGGLSDLSVLTGEAALAPSTSSHAVYPVRQGLVTDWDAMESFWQQCLFQHLRVDPEEHSVVVTEPPLNPPEAREALAEIFFESFNVAGLYCGIQAVLSLYASWAALQKGSTASAPSDLTGVVVDVGEGTTHIVPVVSGYVLGGAVKQLPVAGREISAMVQQALRERGELLPQDTALDVCRQLKERHCYVAPDMLREFQRFDADPGTYVRQLSTPTGASMTVGYERFLAPELLFTPGICPTAAVGTPSLPQAVDACIQMCPIDTRRGLYGNVVLSGGSTMFKNFNRRLAGDLTSITAARLQPGARALDITVRSHPLQRYAAWFGGSLMACHPRFPEVCHTREQYQEYGPSICRINHVFGEGA